MLRELRDILARHPAPLIFMERSIGGQDLSFLVGQIKQAFNALKIIVLTSDVQRDRLMLLHEVGADNFIAKPVSANTLIEKMAFTLRPQSKLGQVIDVAKKLLAQKKYDMSRMRDSETPAILAITRTRSRSRLDSRWRQSRS